LTDHGTRYPPVLLARLAELAEADPEREVCGFVVRLPDGALEVVPVRNAAPPCEARASFAMDGAEELRALLRIDRDGAVVVAIYHSHVDAPAELSRADREGATAAGAPLWPGVEQLVVSVGRGRAGQVRRYRLVGSDFTPAPLD
jgi:[CysO sulfur-carrier protein]-S-L-cysteine hydrolase